MRKDNQHEVKWTFAGRGNQGRATQDGWTTSQTRGGNRRHSHNHTLPGEQDGGEKKVTGQLWAA